MKYRKTVVSGKRPSTIGKFEIIKLEHSAADDIDDKLKNENYGFKCLHYSVSEASGHLTIIVINKTGNAGRVRVKTIDAEAKAGDDYEAVDEVLVFTTG